MEAKRSAILYIRVSTARQAEEGLSLEDQERKLRAYCELHDLTVAAVLIEGGVSGSVPVFERPEGSKIPCLVEGGATELIATKLDRLFRNAADALNTSQWLTRTDPSTGQSRANLHLLSLNVDTSQPMGRFMLALFASLAELEREQARERTADAVEGKRIRGEPMGRAPFGYTYTADKRSLRAVDAEQEPLAAIYGMLGMGMGLRRVAREMDIWYPVPGGWTAGRINRISKAALRPDIDEPTAQELAMLRGLDGPLSMQTVCQTLLLRPCRVAAIMSHLVGAGLLRQQGKRRSLSLDLYYTRKEGSP